MNRPILDNVLPTLLGPVRALLDKKADKKEVAAKLGEKADAAEVVKQLSEKANADETVKTVNGLKPDESGNVDVSGLPTGATAHQQLVTDESGVAKWEDRLAYTIPAQDRLILEPVTVDVTEPNTNGGYKTSAFDCVVYLKKDQTFRYAVIWDGVEYRDIVPTFMSSSQVILSTEAFAILCIGQGVTDDELHTVKLQVMAPTPGTHIFSIYLQDAIPETIKTIDPKYLPGGGLVKTAIIRGDTYDATMEYFRKMQIDPSTAGDNPIKPTPADSFTCTNMSFEEANDFLLNGGVLNVVVLTMGKCVPGIWVCLDPSGERKITGGISFETNFFSFMWTPDSIKFTSG